MRKVVRDGRRRCRGEGVAAARVQAARLGGGGGAEGEGGVHSFLLLPTVAKPHPHYFFLHAQAVSHVGDFFRRRLGVTGERAL